jgi:hypothetical protein
MTQKVSKKKWKYVGWFIKRLDYDEWDDARKFTLWKQSTPDYKNAKVRITIEEL